MKAVQFNAYGDPSKVLECVDMPEPGQPSVGQALVAVEFAPVNPNDLMIPRGIYYSRPPLPALMGNEGVARVLALAKGVTNIAVGDQVALPIGSKTWREQLLVDAAQLFPLPRAGDLKQLAMLSVNPPTASLLLTEFVALRSGDWLIQNAANSGVGRWVIAFAKRRGFRTVNIVRRPELINELKLLGADAVVVDGANLAKEVQTELDNVGVKLGLDGVSGAASGRLAAALSPHATMVVYAAMSEEAMAINPLDVIFKPLALRGFWIGHPEFGSKVAPAMREAAEMIATKEVSLPIARVYPLREVQQAAAHAAKGGKVLLEIAPA
ncbi:MAG TPA: zinc-dependent alcohol dehydrogenase family protein [Planctomycetaceae bacterium]|jgi:NADPH:quinone reductase-like Zn-dependent oxidoreductase|nr:zinc-dependent alcohol dehydrogenase family protein [Planctomycetaceae bacterium]